jgi:L-asparaginase
MRHLILITTGGTIEKTYDEESGDLVNRVSLVQRLLDETEVEVVELMHKDSLEMTEEDRGAILSAVVGAVGRDHGERVDGVVILHGTDTLTQTGDLLESMLGELAVPVVLTGAIRPFEMKPSDALQNLTEAVFATQALESGVYVVAHGRALRFAGVLKDQRRQTFVRG